MKITKMKNGLLKTGAFLLALGLVVNTSCKKDEDESIGDPPTEADAAFTYQESASNPNIIEFTASNSNFQAQWDFGNGDPLVDGTSVTGTYPEAGTYTVTLTVFNSGGSASSSQEIVIANDDVSLLDKPLFTFLTGGINGSGSKTWAIDSVSDGHFGVGPNPSSALGDVPEYYAATACEKSGSTMYDDRYTFTLAGFGFDMITKGQVYVNAQHVSDFSTTVESPVGDFIGDLPDQTGESWTLNEGTDTTLTVTGMSFIGYYVGVHTYKVVSISDNELVLRCEDAADATLSWYVRLVPEGVVTGTCGTAPPVTTYSLPLDFEGGAGSVEVGSFGGSTADIVANPDATGLNTSANVLETVHGNEVWAGIEVNLDAPLDFTTTTKLKLKVWAPVTGDIRIKLEEQSNTNSNIEIDVPITVTNTWVEVEVDYSALTPPQTSTPFDKMALFPGWNVASAGTFYIDDIRQE